MKRVLLYYSTVDGHTHKICDRIEEVLNAKKYVVTRICVEQQSFPKLEEYDLLVFGSSIRHGKHNKTLLKFIENQSEQIESKQNAFFSTNLVARKSDKRTAETNPYVRKFLQKSRWKPQKIGVFAGLLDYPKYSFFDRLMILLIMKITKGPTDPTATIEYTDWDEVEKFASEL